MLLDSKGFDLWADEYDKSVNLSEESNEYPFAGYKDVLNYIYNIVRENDYVNILDIGFGTGILTARLYDEGCNITGIDFSENMINIAKQKMPQATLLKWDFSLGLPDTIKNSKFDCIICTYAIHHLTDKEKVIFVKLLSSMLNEKGKILIGDISFEKRSELEKCKETYMEYWDEDEIYFIANEMGDDLNSEFSSKYMKMSHCAGVMVLVKRLEQYVEIKRIEDQELKEKIARRVLENLPDWFGLPESIEKYIQEGKSLPFWAAIKDNQEIGFINLKETSSETAEIYCMGVMKDFHGMGVGRLLFHELLNNAKKNGYEFLQVKTVDEGHYAEYDQTAIFYIKMGFRKLEVFPSLWDRWNPCLILIMSVR